MQILMQRYEICIEIEEEYVECINFYNHSNNKIINNIIRYSFVYSSRVINGSIQMTCC